MTAESPSVPVLPERFFTPSPAKLAVLSILSGGYYPTYWLLKYWQAMRDSGYKKTIPWLRWIFYPFYAYGCFGWIEEAARGSGITLRWTAGVLAAAFFVLTFISWIVSDYGILSLLNFVPVMAANNAAIAVNERFVAGFEPDGHVSALDAWVTLGGGALFLIMIGCDYITAHYVTPLLHNLAGSMPPQTYGF